MNSLIQVKQEFSIYLVTNDFVLFYLKYIIFNNTCQTYLITNEFLLFYLLQIIFNDIS